jgi:hypothetical protein
MSRRSLSPFLLALTLGCSDSPVTIPASDGDEVRLIVDATRNLPERPQGIAVTPDGRFVLVATYIGFEILVLDGESLQTVTSTRMLNPWGITVDPGGGRVWVAGKHGIMALALPGLEELAQFPLRTRILARAFQPNTLYAIDPSAGQVVRFDAVRGEILASLAHPSVISDTACLALADGQALLAGNDNGPLLVLDPIDLSLEREIALPSGCWAVVPLDDDGKALVLSGEEDSLGQFPTASVVDWRTGDSRQVSVPRPSGSVPWTEYGYGNPWVRVDDLIFAPGRQGILVADARSGDVLDFIEGTPSTEGSVYCCEIAWDAVRRRLLIVGDYLAGDHLTGKLVSYRIER